MSEKKPFDCVEMKHNAARKIKKELKGKSIEEKLAYWNKEYQKQKKSKVSAVNQAG